LYQHAALWAIEREAKVRYTSDHSIISTAYMQDIGAVFNRIQENKKKLKDIRSAYTDALQSSQQYVDLKEEMGVMREKLKSLEATIKDGFSGEFTQMDDLKIDVASDMELLTDIAMTQLMKGQTVAVTDEYDNEYEPLFKVNFKKVK
jgi:predicted  nucleic acid-binding Zn-ribbon protein